jgi:hypothetical protein
VALRPEPSADNINKDCAVRDPARPRTNARVLDLGQLGESVVVVAPHPDDESIACGGLIALLARRSVVVNVIIVTDGCGSHPNSSAYPPERLAKRLPISELKSAACGFAVCPTGSYPLKALLDLPRRWIRLSA